MNDRDKKLIKKIAKIAMLIIVVVILLIAGLKILESVKEKRDLLARKKYEKIYYTPNDFIYEEDDGKIFLAETTADNTIDLWSYDENYEEIIRGKIDLGEERRYPTYVSKDDDGYFMLFTNKSSLEKPIMYAARVNNALEEVWKLPINLQSPVEELMECITNTDGSKIFYMAQVNGAKAKNNLISISKDGNILLNKPLENVATGSLVDLYVKEGEIGVVVRSNVGVDDERHIKMTTYGYNVSDEISEYKKSTDIANTVNIDGNKYVYGSMNKKGYLTKLNENNEEVWKKEFELKDETRIGEVYFAKKQADGNLAIAYVEYKERTDFRKERMNDLFNVNDVIILNSEGEKIKSVDLIELVDARYAPLKYDIDNNNNVYVYASTSKYTSIIIKLDSNLKLNRRINLDETIYPRFVTVSSSGAIYYSDINEDKTIVTLRKAKDTDGQIKEEDNLNVYSEDNLNVYSEATN